MSDLIRPWLPEDAIALRPLVLDLLREQRVGGSLLVPDERNTDLVIAEGTAAAGRGDPCLIAFDDSVAPLAVGCCIWMGKGSPLGLSRRVCHAFGMYVRAEYRRQGWSQRIYDAAITQARDAGYEAAEGLAVRTAGLHAAMAVGARPVGVLLRRYL